MVCSACLKKLARVPLTALENTCVRYYVTVLTVGPLLGSFITEPAAMTIAALLLARQFYDLKPSMMLRYATLGLLFVNISIGGTLTHFAAPPVLMVARTWEWDTAFMIGHFGWRSALAIVVSTVAYLLIFRNQFTALAARLDLIPMTRLTTVLAPTANADSAR